MSVSKDILLNKFKKKARSIQKDQSITRAQALERIAIQSGFLSWRELVANIQSGKLTSDASNKRFYSHEVDDLTPSKQVRGVYNSRIQIRESLVRISPDEAPDLKALTICIRSNIKRIISNSNDHVCICLTVYIPLKFESQLADPDAYLHLIVAHYPHHIFMQHFFRDEAFCPWIDELPNFANQIYQEILESIKE